MGGGGGGKRGWTISKKVPVQQKLGRGGMGKKIDQVLSANHALCLT